MRAEIIHISYAGPDRFITDSVGKVWKFEMHRYFGPAVLKKNGDVAERQPGERSPFWQAVMHWEQQGERVDERGYCIWTAPEEQRLVHLGGKHYALDGSALAERAIVASKEN